VNHRTTPHGAVAATDMFDGLARDAETTFR
jgi:hypothetical protein